MDYKESIEWLFGRLPMFSRIGAAAYKPGLDTTLQLDKWYDHPHTKYKTIHIAGTNGKGSSSHMIAAMLQAQGYKTGLYTSPHLVDFRERIKVNGEMIPEEAVCDFVERYRSSGYEGSPSFFELTMMMAFDWFARAGVDYAVIETGMGGRLDSTNVITPEACIITNIQWDHTQFLGDTLPKIASEKAGIIKPGIPVTIGEAEGEIREVFRKKAEEVGAPIRFADDVAPIQHIEHAPDGGWQGKSAVCGDFYSPLGGDYQKANIRTVLTAVGMLREAGITLSDESVRRGLAEVDTLTGLRGRWSVISKHPLTICDTGHNEAGINYNMAQLAKLRSQREGCTLRMVIGFVADKAIDHILSLMPKDAVYYATNAQIPRALPVADLYAKMKEKGFAVAPYPDVDAAYSAAGADAAPDDIVYIGGSTFIVADFLANRG